MFKQHSLIHIYWDCFLCAPFSSYLQPEFFWWCQWFDVFEPSQYFHDYHRIIFKAQTWPHILMRIENFFIILLTLLKKSTWIYYHEKTNTQGPCNQIMNFSQSQLFFLQNSLSSIQNACIYSNILLYFVCDKNTVN